MKKNNVEICEFLFATPTNTPTDEGEISNDLNNPTVFTPLTFDCLKPDDQIWLNGIFHIDNDVHDAPVLIQHQILKNGVAIYTAATEVESGSTGNILSQQYVDQITTLQKDVTYSLAVAFSQEPGVRLQGPITFTAARLTKNKNF